MPDFLDQLPEIFVSRTAISAQVNQAVQQNKLRKLGSRLYTKNLSAQPEDIVRRNWYFLLPDYYPDALIADRTAIENKPAEDGSVFIVSSKEKTIKLPGITFKSRAGKGALDSDKPFVGGARLSSQPRAFLENMRVSRARNGGVSRTLSRSEMEQCLEKIIRVGGNENTLNEIRDEARRIAEELDAQQEFDLLDELIGSMLGTRNAALESPTGKARQKGLPYDPDRQQLFENLFNALSATAPVYRSVDTMTEKAKSNLSFFEAYFSNFIEGTEFDLGEAKAIVFEGKIPSERPEDAHDVLGTYRIVSDYHEMSRIPDSLEELEEILKTRHVAFMQSRPDKLPGEFKEKRNQAGATQFVDPAMVSGTLNLGLEFYRALSIPLHRAIYLMFLVSEVHPFVDGNGRAARMMMNAELVHAGEQKIIIPTVYRNNYLSALKALSHNDRAEPLIRTLDFAQKFAQSIEWDDFDEARTQLQKANAFLDPNFADDQGIRLTSR